MKIGKEELRSINLVIGRKNKVLEVLQNIVSHSMVVHRLHHRLFLFLFLWLAYIFARCSSKRPSQIGWALLYAFKYIIKWWRLNSPDGRNICISSGLVRSHVVHSAAETVATGTIEYWFSHQQRQQRGSRRKISFQFLSFRSAALKLMFACLLECIRKSRKN